MPTSRGSSRGKGWEDTTGISPKTWKPSRKQRRQEHYKINCSPALNSCSRVPLKVCIMCLCFIHSLHAFYNFWQGVPLGDLETIYWWTSTKRTRGRSVTLLLWLPAPLYLCYLFKLIHAMALDGNMHGKYCLKVRFISIPVLNLDMVYLWHPSNLIPMMALNGNMHGKYCFSGVFLFQFRI